MSELIYRIFTVLSTALIFLALTFSVNTKDLTVKEETFEKDIHSRQVVTMRGEHELTYYTIEFDEFHPIGRY